MKPINLVHPARGDVTYILSAEREANGPSGSEANVDAMASLAQSLEGIRTNGWAYNVHPVAGAYCGRPEESLAVVGKDTTELWLAVTRLAMRHDQESILIVDHHAQGKLQFVGNGLSYSNIGTMVAVDPTDLATLEAYSVIKSTGECFTFA
jgi:hypothetical protein